MSVLLIYAQHLLSTARRQKHNIVSIWLQRQPLVRWFMWCGFFFIIIRCLSVNDVLLLLVAMLVVDLTLCY